VTDGDYSAWAQGTVTDGDFLRGLLELQPRSWLVDDSVAQLQQRLMVALTVCNNDGFFCIVVSQAEV